jgi:poly-beta-hydroxyalkanoate depolymerase
MFEKLGRKEIKIGERTFKYVDCGDVVLLDTTGHQDLKHDEIKQQTVDFENKEKMILFPFDYVQKFSVPVDDKKYFLRYKLADGKKITSDQPYTPEEINNCYFVAVAPENEDYVGYISTNLRQVAPESFQFAVIMSNVKVLLVENLEK